MAEDIREDESRRIGDLLRADAPPPRDAAFRIGVLQRRERQRFQRRSMVLFASAIVLAAIFAFGVNNGADIFAIAAIALLCALLAVFGVTSVRGVREVMRRMRESGKS